MLVATFRWIICGVLIAINVEEKTVYAGVRNIDTKVVGGYSCPIWQHPYAVSIRYTLSSLHHCGGSLLSKKWVLTAAHCCLTKYRIGYLSVYAGFSSTYKNGVRSLVIEQFVHESYTVKPVRNDIALMKLDRPIAEGPKIRYVKLPKPYKITHPEITEICPSSVILGWGDQYEKDAHGHPVEPKIRPHDEHLQCANIPAITNYECSMRILKSVPTSIFCAYRERKDACQGDSGGPVMCNGVQYGIVSTGIGCAHKNYPGLYTRVDMYIDFINEKGGDAVINRLSDILKVYIVINVAIIRFIV